MRSKIIISNEVQVAFPSSLAIIFTFITFFVHPGIVCQKYRSVVQKESVAIGGISLSEEK